MNPYTTHLKIPDELYWVIRGKLDCNPEIPEDEVATLFVIIITKCGNCTPTPTQIVKVLVEKAPHTRPKVEAEGPKCRILNRHWSFGLFSSSLIRILWQKSNKFGKYISKVPAILLIRLHTEERIRNPTVYEL